MTGKITRIFLTRGFGFIKDENGEDRFFHIDEVITTWEGLRAGDAVTFVPATRGSRGNGLRAVQVERVEVAHDRQPAS